VFYYIYFSSYVDIILIIDNRIVKIYLSTSILYLIYVFTLTISNKIINLNIKIMESSKKKPVLLRLDSKEDRRI
jgi:hypothetical protein